MLLSGEEPGGYRLLTVAQLIYNALQIADGFFLAHHLHSIKLFTSQRNYYVIES